MVATATIATAALVAAVIGGGISAYSAVEQGQQAERMANYNAAVQRTNASVQEQMAQRQASAQSAMYDQQKAAVQQQQAANLAQAKEEIRRQEMAKDALMSKQRAAYAGAGIITQGTPLALLADTEVKYRTAEADSLYQTEVKNHSLNYEISGLDYRKNLLDLDVAGARAGARISNAYADLTALQGKYDAQAGMLKAGSTLLSTAGTAGGNYATYKKQGIIS